MNGWLSEIYDISLNLEETGMESSKERKRKRQTN